MSVHYIIDGYNVLKKIPQISKLELKQGRQSLLDIIKKYNLCGKNEVTIAFDGRADVISYAHKSPYVVKFSENESADKLIERLVKKSENPQKVIVVTDDKELRFNVKRLGAEVISVKEFGKKIPEKKSKERPIKKQPLKQDEAKKITEELKRIWLDKI
jgi:predicted RNA-binding protein with PIN domain